MVDDTRQEPTDGVPPSDRPGEDPAEALRRKRRRKRQLWAAGLVTLGLAGGAWALIANRPLPTTHVRLEVDVTCPMLLSAEISGYREDGRSETVRFPETLSAPLPDAPGRTFVFEANAPPSSHVYLYADRPQKTPGSHRPPCGRTACRIFADGALVLETLSTTGDSLRCQATTDARPATPPKPIARAFADPLSVPAHPSR